MDVEGLVVEAGTHRHGRHLAAHIEHQALHPQFLPVGEGPVQGHQLHAGVLLLGPALVPAVGQGFGVGQGLFGQGQDGHLGVFRQEAVDVVALGLEFFALQVCQVIDGINIVMTVPPAVEGEPVGIPGLQVLHIPGIQTREPQGDAPLPGVCHQRFDGGPGIAGTDGVGVHGPAAKMGEQQQIIPHPGGALAAPDVQIGEGKGAAPVGCVAQQGVELGLLLEGKSFEWDHGVPPECFF